MILVVFGLDCIYYSFSSVQRGSSLIIFKVQRGVSVIATHDARGYLLLSLKFIG